jgi:hypothetical protein
MCRCLCSALLLPQARWTRSTPDKNVPTAVLVHGILGSRRNMSSFARMLVEVSA